MTVTHIIPLLFADQAVKDKLFTFSTSFPEPLGQFQPNSAQTSLGKGDSSLSNEGPCPFPGGDNYEVPKIY